MNKKQIGALSLGIGFLMDIIGVVVISGIIHGAGALATTANLIVWFGVSMLLSTFGVLCFLGRSHGSGR